MNHALPNSRYRSSRKQRSLSPARLRRALPALAAAVFLPAPEPALAADPAFTGDPVLSSDTGHILLNWQADEPVTLTIAREGMRPPAKPVYQGSESSYFLSGLSDGNYRLQLRSQSGAVSDPVTLQVAHQSLAQALWLTLIGLVITIALVAAILKGARDG